jgi:AraC-like DNA-binding protein
MKYPLSHIPNWPELGLESRWSASALAKRCQVSLRTLQRHFIKHTGKSPKTWLIAERRRQVRARMSDGRTVKETAFDLNYKHQNHLSTDFKKGFGMYPSEEAAQRPAKKSPAVAVL